MLTVSQGIGRLGLVLGLIQFYIIISLVGNFFFFFSSRRRHTRFDCDWSSDVCSSDLSEYRIGGTSLSSPIMAGIFALANQARDAAGKADLGFANPLLYSLNSSSAVTEDRKSVV